MQEHLGLTREQAVPIIQSLFIKLGQTFLEIMYMPALTPAKLEQYVKIDHREYLDQAASEGHGVVLLTGHLGNWEWLGGALAAAGFPMAGIAKPQPNAQYTRILNEHRVKVGMEIFSRGTTEIVAAAKAMKRGKVIGFLADQDGGKNGVFINFLGKMASTPLGSATFSWRFKAPVVPAFIVRRPEGGHQVILQPPLHCPYTGDEARDLAEFTGKIVAITEDIIRQYPDEWLWFQKRWNTPYQEANPQTSGKTGEAM
jgi:KDO2-lipid IV(A) lauroyltransferase